MLVALTVFALLSVLVAQSLASMGRNYARLREGHELSVTVARLQALMDQASTLGEGEEDGMVPNLILADGPPGGATLTLERPNGRVLRASLPAGERLRLAHGAGSLSGLLWVDRGEDTASLVVSRTHVTAPRNCRFDQVGRRCLQDGH